MLIATIATLVFTLPSTGQHRWVNPLDGVDSVHVECSGTDSIHELHTAYLWGSLLTGGGYAVRDSHSVVGREGQQDSFTVTQPGHYYVTTRNTAGMSCAGNEVYVPPDTTVTSVPIEERTHGRVVSRRLYSVLWGRPVDLNSHIASGVYWEKRKYQDGFESKRKIVIVR